MRRCYFRLICAFRGNYIAEELCEQCETDNQSEVSGDDFDEEEDVASKEDGAFRPVDDWSVRTPDGDQPLSTSLSEETDNSQSGTGYGALHRAVTHSTSFPRSEVQIEVDESFFMLETLASNAGRCFIEVEEWLLSNDFKAYADCYLCWVHKYIIKVRDVLRSDYVLRVLDSFAGNPGHP